MSTIAEPLQKGKKASRTKPRPAAPYDDVRHTALAPAAAPELPEPSLETVAAAQEGKPREQVQYCLAYPKCGGPKSCVDCRTVQEPSGDPPGEAPEGAPIARATIVRLHHALGEILAGLRGRPFVWNDGQRDLFVPLLHEAGIELVTVNGAKKRGHLVKPRARPVGRLCGAATQIAELYVLHVQTLLGPKVTIFAGRLPPLHGVPSVPSSEPTP